MPTYKPGYWGSARGRRNEYSVTFIMKRDGASLRLTTPQMNGLGKSFKTGYKVRDPSEDKGIKPYCSKWVAHGGRENKGVGVVNVSIEYGRKKEKRRKMKE